jgi:hypothetical protein
METLSLFISQNAVNIRFTMNNTGKTKAESPKYGKVLGAMNLFKKTDNSKHIIIQCITIKILFLLLLLANFIFV